MAAKKKVAKSVNMDLVPKKVAVVGSRAFKDYNFLKKKLDTVKDRISMLVSGGAEGADSLADRWAKDNGKSILIHYSDWKQWGKRAGMIRNKKIVRDADIVVAFWDGSSVGTQSSIKLAKELKKQLIIVDV